jgi:hypothetical protein
MGLYREVVEQAVAIVAQVTAEAIDAGRGLPAEARLRAYVRVHGERVARHGLVPGLHQLIHRELQDPTEVLSTLIEQLWRPRFLYLGEIVSELTGLPPDDPRVIRSVVSIHAQVVTMRPSPALDHMGQRVHRALSTAAVIEHIAAFSLAGLAAYRTGH